METIREARLEGIEKANSVLEEYGHPQLLSDGTAPVDVFKIVEVFHVPLYFRPLDGLLGLYIPPPTGPGILVTTKRSAHIQRFTAAHELGHFLLDHKTASLDSKVGVPRRRGQINYLQEAAADAFASELLLPRWLITAHARKRNWSRADLTIPDIVYQLSLRLATSYEATCLALRGHEIVTAQELESLLKITPKSCKEKVAGDLKPNTWHADIWSITGLDAGARIIGTPDDILILDLEEHTSAGYKWDTNLLSNFGLNVIQDSRKQMSEAVGSSSLRRIALQGSSQVDFEIAERRPWSAAEPIETLQLNLQLDGARFLPLGLH